MEANQPIRLEDPATGFSAYATSDFTLARDPGRGVYELRSESRGTVEYMRVTSAQAPADAARAAVEQRGLSAVSERSDESRAVVVAQHPDGQRWTVDVRRDGDGTLSVAAFAGPDERTLEWVAASAAGGEPVTLARTEAERAIEPIELIPFTNSDQSASGLCPAEPGWQRGGVKGALEVANPMRGELHLGIPATVVLPYTATAAMAPAYGNTWVIAPYMPAAQAVVHAWPQLRNSLEPGVGFGAVQVDSGQPVNYGPGFDAGIFEIRWTRAGVPWRGAIVAATAPLPADERWLFYFSQLGVPDSDDSSVSQALLKAWRAWDPSASQGPRNAEAQAALEASFETLQEMRTLRLETEKTALDNWSAQFRA